MPVTEVYAQWVVSNLRPRFLHVRNDGCVRFNHWQEYEVRSTILLNNEVKFKLTLIY